MEMKKQKDANLQALQDSLHEAFRQNPGAGLLTDAADYRRSLIHSKDIRYFMNPDDYLEWRYSGSALYAPQPVLDTAHHEPWQWGDVIEVRPADWLNTLLDGLALRYSAGDIQQAADLAAAEKSGIPVAEIQIQRAISLHVPDFVPLVPDVEWTAGRDEMEKCINTFIRNFQAGAKAAAEKVDHEFMQKLQDEAREKTQRYIDYMEPWRRPRRALTRGWKRQSWTEQWYETGYRHFMDVYYRERLDPGI